MLLLFRRDSRQIRQCNPIFFASAMEDYGTRVVARCTTTTDETLDVFIVSLSMTLLMGLLNPRGELSTVAGRCGGDANQEGSGVPGASLGRPLGVLWASPADGTDGAKKFRAVLLGERALLPCVCVLRCGHDIARRALAGTRPCHRFWRFCRALARGLRAVF